MELRRILGRYLRWGTLGACTAALTLATTPLIAAGTEIVPVQSQALRPYYANYNGRSAQMTGQIIEYKANQVADQRGLTGAAREAFIATSLAAGGTAVAAGVTGSARVQNAAVGGAMGGVVGAVGFGGGCLLAAAVTTAGFATPLCALPLLVGGIGSGVAVGGFMGLFNGGDDTKVQNPGNMSSNAPVSGSNIKPVDQGASTANADYFLFKPNPAQNFAAGFARAGLNRTFLCAGAAQYDSQFHECMFIQVGTPQPDGDAYGALRYGEPWSLRQWKFCSGYYRGNSCGSDETMYWSQPADGMGAPRDSYSQGSNTLSVILIMGQGLGSMNGTQPTIPSRTFVQTNQAGYSLPGLADNPALAGKLDNQLSDDAIAKFMNELMKNMPAGNGLQPDPSNPITADDVANALAKTPAARATLGDMVRPFAPPGQAPQLGTVSNPVTTNYQNAPTQNPSTGSTTGSSTGTGTGSTTGTSADNPTYTKEVGPTDSEKSGAVDGIMAPIQTLLNAIPKPTFGTRAVACPRLSIDMRGPTMKKIGMDFQLDTDFHCQLADKMQTPIQAFMLILAGLIAYRKFMSA